MAKPKQPLRLAAAGRKRLERAGAGLHARRRRRPVQPVIGTDAPGTIYVVWRGKRNGGTYTDLYFASRPPGGAWSPALKLNTSTANVTDDRISSSSKTAPCS